MLIKNKKISKNALMMLCTIMILGGMILSNTDIIAAGPASDTLTYANLGGHKDASTGVWSVVHSGEPYWCTTPGGHLGSYVTGGKWMPGHPPHGQCSVKHIYKKTKTVGTYTTFDSFRNYLGSTAAQAKVFKNWFGSTGSASASGSKAASPTNNNYEIKDGQLLVGPFRYTHSLTNAEVTGKSMSVKNGGTDISYTIYNSSKDGVISLNNITSGTTFYLLVSTDVSD